MNDRIENIAEHYTLDELESLKVLLAKIEKNKKTVLNSSINVYKFSQEYKKYIKITFSSSYIKSVVLSLKHLSEFFGNHKLLVELSVKNIEEFEKEQLRKDLPQFNVGDTLKVAWVDNTGGHDELETALE